MERCAAACLVLSAVIVSPYVVAAPSLKATTHELFHAEVPEHTVAKLRNLIMHQEMFYYAYEGPNPPKLPQLWQHHQWYGGPGPFIHITEIPLTEARDLVRGLQIHHEAKASLAWRPWTENLYHSVAESIFTVYQHGCTYFKLCTHAALTSQLAAVFHDIDHPGNPHVEWDVALPPAAEAIQCYSKRSIEMRAPAYKNSTFIFGEAVTGIGPHDRAMGYNERHYEVFTTPPIKLGHGFRDTMAKCMRMSYLKHGRRKPYRVTLVNRSTKGGRHMYNADTMVQRMNELPDVDARLEYVDGATMRKQFQIASQSDIIIYVHGAAMGAFCFMSPDAVVIEYGHKLHDSHLHGFLIQLMDDVSVPASFIGVSPSGSHSIIPKLEYFRGRKEFLEMSLEHRWELLSTGECIPAYRGECQHMAHFMLQAEWKVLEPALQLAFGLIDSGEHRFILLDRDDGFRQLLHRHPETGQRSQVEFLP
ncbi:hypothetical protein WJX73_002802 [Symbiochloris irregularis]|uniref:Glycosyltransferase 61 catalytic domain-containing protein n=1 Tax=Symbiochloris irregularis TaxID=706552 RepID=A0AAW1NQR3_9CHLO